MQFRAQYPSVIPASFRAKDDLLVRLIDSDAFGNGYDPIVIVAPDGAFVGAAINVSGGSGEYFLFKNGVLFSGPFVGPTIQIPSGFLVDDQIAVKDSEGSTSNIFSIISEPWSSGSDAWVSGSVAWSL